MKTVPFNYPYARTYIELFLAGTINFIGQSLQVVANQNANPTTVHLIGYMGIAYMFMADIAFFDPYLSFYQIAGVLICVTCSVAVVTYKMTIEKSKNEDEKKPPKDSKGTTNTI